MSWFGELCGTARPSFALNNFSYRFLAFLVSVMSGDSNLLSIVPFNHLDDSLFNLVLYEMSYGPVIYDGDRP